MMGYGEETKAQLTFSAERLYRKGLFIGCLFKNGWFDVAAE